MALQGTEDSKNHTNLSDNEQEEFSDSFVCCVCLDLLYKPIVLCKAALFSIRHPYYHFPTICQMLHFLLMKMYPIAYKRREKQTLEEEKKTGYYSPQFDVDDYTSGSKAKVDHPGSSSSCNTINLVSNPLKAGSSASMEQSGLATHEQAEGTTCSQHISDGTPESIVTLSVKDKNLPQNKHCGQQKITVADVTCEACQQLLFHPVVLNCGHVYCESCILNLADEMLRCQICQSPHPRGFPKVCLELDHFLEEQFPEEYAKQRDAVQLRHIKDKLESPSSCSLDNDKKGQSIAWWSDPHSKVHIGVGCDFCGMYPIVGDRYRCKDCKEKIGFDLCGDCYKSRSKLPGRFNQQHTSEHQFELIRINVIHNIMRLVTGQLGDGSIDNVPLEHLDFTSDDPNDDDGEDTQNDSEVGFGWRIQDEPASSLRGLCDLSIEDRDFLEVSVEDSPLDQWIPLL
ncbi:E3 ubiquitin-protein ligase PRT1-like isoform X1 [Senna tora]|uniref:E3 ubiquitin-protein ligase PRT1-like isoform X1 n=1 Tax=Senna tora TaxID=362788 RepID=A0A835CJK5_9FABA|nr:E3 ubiquitin-protein ligase PRT1-like isoform X1 [Senna tora]